MSAPHSDRGDELRALANKLKTEKHFFNKTDHLLKAADKFVQAGNAYKIDRDFVSAGECYISASEIYQQTGNKIELVTALEEASKAYEKQPQTIGSSVDALKKIADIKLQDRKPVDAANYYVNCAKILAKGGKIQESIQTVQQAVQIYEKENQKTLAAKSLDNLAEYLISENNFLSAAEILIKISYIRLQNSLTQGSSGGIFFRAAMCYLRTQDYIGAQKALDAYLEQNPAYQRASDCVFISQLLKSLISGETNDLENLVRTFTRQKTCDKFTIDTLSLIVGIATNDDIL